MQITEKGLLELTDRELRQCRSLSLRSDGLMCDDLTASRYAESRPSRNRRKGRVWLMKDGDTLVSWALLTPRYKERGYDAQFYTRKSERGKGYASELMVRLKEVCPKPYVLPHDRKSGDFFKKHRQFVRIQDHFRMWVM